MLLHGNRSALSYRKSSIKLPPLPLSNKPSPFKGKKVNKPPLSIKRPVSNKPSPFKGKKVNRPPLSIKRPPLK